MSEPRCAVRSCSEDAASRCSWRTSFLDPETGARVFTGDSCGMFLCGTHTQLVSLRPLCLWHSERAKDLVTR